MEAVAPSALATIQTAMSGPTAQRRQALAALHGWLQFGVAPGLVAPLISMAMEAFGHAELTEAAVDALVEFMTSPAYMHNDGVAAGLVGPIASLRSTLTAAAASMLHHERYNVLVEQPAHALAWTNCMWVRRWR